MTQLLITSVVNMLVLSSMYIAVALGFAFLFNIMGIMNFAHGAIYMVAGYICYQFSVEFGVNVLLSFVLSVCIVAAFGVFLEKFCFRPFFGDLNRTMVVCIGIIILLRRPSTYWGGRPRGPYPPSLRAFLKPGPYPLACRR